MIIFKLYLARDNYFAKKYTFGLLTDVYNTIDALSNEYDEYLIIKHNTELNQDEVFEHNKIEHQARKRKR